MVDNEATDGRYYWLKLQRDFFKRHDVRIVEGMPNGKDYILFYLKLLCESIDHDGRLRFSDAVPYNDQMLSIITDTNIDIVRRAIQIFTELKLMEIMDDGTFYLTEVENMVGSETEWAKKKRDYRRTIKGQCQDNVLPLSDKSKSKSKNKSKNNILLPSADAPAESSSSSLPDKSKKVPYQRILELYYELCPNMSAVRPVNKYTDEIKKSVKARFSEYSLEDFETVFKKAEASDFLNNRSDVTFQASFDWLMRPKNFSKALNGNFDNIAKKPKEVIKGTDIPMSIVADGTRDEYPETEAHFE